MTRPPPDIQTFLDDLPEQTRSALLDLRETVRSVESNLEERIGYGVPAFYYRKRPLVSYGATSRHCALYVQSPTVVEAYRTALEGYDLAKGTVRFQADRPLPPDVVVSLVRARMAEIDAR
ncbi:MAG TPA: DUF1801 domain-containing protein [Acidimicrobiia bacterium]|nr:DUF1801 domain-containing protein [Acidimicrobiia bacterium]